MLRIRSRNKVVTHLSLIIFALLTTYIWRIEIYHHGWHGLTWLSYFHLAIPFSFAMFILWVNTFFVYSDLLVRFKANLFLLLFIVIGYFVHEYSLNYIFISGPRAMFLLMMEWYKKVFYVFLSCVVLPFFPLLLIFCLRLVKLKVPLLVALLSSILYIASPFISIIVLELVSHEGGADFIHTIKSGVVFSMLFYSLGLLLIYIKDIADNYGSGTYEILDFSEYDK